MDIHKNARLTPSGRETLAMPRPACANNRSLKTPNLEYGPPETSPLSPMDRNRYVQLNIESTTCEQFPPKPLILNNRSFAFSRYQTGGDPAIAGRGRSR
jgi:hypothetical protein